jgi:hypothetical protein
MLTSTPICVRRTGTVEEADLIVAWLEDAGVHASVVGRDSFGVQAFGVTDEEGVGIYVNDPAAAERAKALLAEHDRRQAGRLAVAAAGGTTDVACEECGEVNSFEIHLRGTTQTCSCCGANLDVPADDE